MERKTAWNEYKKKDIEKAGKIKRRLPRIPGSRKNGARVCKGSVRQAEEAGYVSLDTYSKRKS